jgi:KRAB domain-containing zinc finger protein
MSKVMLFRNSSISKKPDLQSDEKPFKCPVCTKSFNQNSDLVRHIRVHTGEKLLACSLCKKTFSSSSYLCLHTRVSPVVILLISENTQEFTQGKNHLIVQ